MDQLIFFLGRTHPLLVHLPIGILLMAASMELLVLVRRFAYLKPALPITWRVGAASAVVSCVAGFALKQEGGYDEEMLLYHQWSGIALALFSSVASVLSQKGALLGKIRLIVVVPMFILTTVAGHYGGSLTHGGEFLGEPILALTGVESKGAVVERKPVQDTAQAVVYRDLVEPVLIEKCSRCHNSSKRKGGLRVDDYQHLMKGGKNGAVIVAGAPSQSELIRRIMLGDDDKEKMPPRGKPQLTAQELQLIRWWLGEGKASSEVRVAELSGTSDVAFLFSGNVHAGAEPPPGEAFFPEVTLSPAPAEAIDALEENGVIIKKVSDDAEFLFVNLVNVPEFGDGLAALLLPLKEHVTWLKAGKSSITDESLRIIGQMPNLTRLNLEYTSVSDEGILRLKDLKHLTYLNLVNTRVGDQSIAVLQQLKSLRALYLWNSEVSLSGAEVLRQKIPGIDVNTGVK